MATSKKRGSSSLSVEKLPKGSQSTSSMNGFDIPPEIIASITLAVTERLETTISSVLDRHVRQAIEELKTGFQERLNILQERCVDLERALTYDAERHADEVQELKLRLTSLENRMEATKIEMNFVIDGMPEEENETSELTKEIVRQAADKLQLNLESGSVLSASRLGKRKLTTGGQSDRPRRILVRTISKETKNRFMAAKASLRESLPGVYLNDDLTVAEQQTRRQLVPIYKFLRGKNVRCRLERGSLVIDGKGYFSLDSVRRAVQARIADYPPSVQPCILEELDKYKRTSRSPVSTSATPTRTLSTTEQSGNAIHQD